MTALAQIDGLDPNTCHRRISHLVSGVTLVRLVMAGGGWMTIAEVQRAVSDIPRNGKFFSENCISARIRDQRKEKHGGHFVERRLRPGSKNLFEYQLTLQKIGVKS